MLFNKGQQAGIGETLGEHKAPSLWRGRRWLTNHLSAHRDQHRSGTARPNPLSGGCQGARGGGHRHGARVGAEHSTQGDGHSPVTAEVFCPDPGEFLRQRRILSISMATRSPKDRDASGLGPPRDTSLGLQPVFPDCHRHPLTSTPSRTSTYIHISFRTSSTKGEPTL